jgi:hypothetical protein
MKLFLISISLLLALTACDDAKKAGDDTARELTGSNMVQQEKKMKQQLNAIEQQQAERMKQIEE